MMLAWFRNSAGPKRRAAERAERLTRGRGDRYAERAPLRTRSLGPRNGYAYIEHPEDTMRVFQSVPVPIRGARPLMSRGFPSC